VNATIGTGLDCLAYVQLRTTLDCDAGSVGPDKGDHSKYELRLGRRRRNRGLRRGEQADRGGNEKGGGVKSAGLRPWLSQKALPFSDEYGSPRNRSAWF
jgi:hypothetical protein